MADIYYTVSSDLHRMARLEGGEVIEIDFEIQGKPISLLSGIYLGRIVEIQRPLRAAFVDIGEEKLGMLPLQEGNLPQVNKGDAVLVQVTRTANPGEGKGVRLTRLITLSLGPLLYTPFKPGFNLSKKLKEREVFKTFFDIKKEEGLVVRHWAVPDDSLRKQLLELREEWESLQKQLNAKPPVCLIPAPDMLTRILRSMNSSDTLRVDNLQIQAKSKGVATYSKETAFDDRCEEAWESLQESEISIPQGGTLYIEETRGLTVIDVNSQGALRQSELFNRKAIKEALRQIQLRDLGGKIVLDLIDSPKALDPLIKGLSLPSNLEIWGLSTMGLLEMIRRRRRLSLPQRLNLQLN